MPGIQAVTEFSDSTGGNEKGRGSGRGCQPDGLHYPIPGTYDDQEVSDIAQLLNATERGDSKAAEELVPAVYEELRRLANYLLTQERPGQTLQATALVHEAYLRLVGGNGGWGERRQFFCAVAQAMRRILIESARRKQRIRHGGGTQRVSLEEIELPAAMPSEELIALEEGLNGLQKLDAQAADLIALHFFAGFTLEQAGQLLGVSRRTAYRKWEFARAWLFREIRSG